MRIAYVKSAGRGALDHVLAQLADRLSGDGLRVCGAVQFNTDREDCRGCDMDVRVLPDGPVIRISQSLGPEARGCRLDASGLETAVHEVARRLDLGADVLLLNKFGKQEADGRGFRDAIAEALSRGIPVIIGVNGLNEPAFLAFTDGLAARLDPDLDGLVDWLNSGRRGQARVA